MRVFICYEDKRLPLDLQDGDTVQKIKDFISDHFEIPSPYGHPLGKEKKRLALSYAGSDLEPHWLLTDLGIVPGSTIRAFMKDQVKPVLYIATMYNGKAFPVLDKLELRTLSVADLRGLISRKTGLPVGVFRMITQVDLEMFDCHLMEEYDVEEGCTIRVETWDGWNEFLSSCMLGFTTQAMSQMASDEVVSRYQMKVAMYIAAHCGHVDLAVSLMRQGIRPDEATGEHPSRQWCKNVSHTDSLKAPVHEAAEMGQLGVLRTFVNQSVCFVMARDGNDLTPLNIALRKQQRACASFLLTKQWSRISYNNANSLPLSIFTKMKKWSLKAKEKTLLVKGQLKTSLKNPRKVVPMGALVGHGVQLDGFSRSKLSTKPRSYVKAEEDRAKEQERKRKKIYTYEELRKGPDPETYFKNVQRMEEMKLPKVSKWGKMFNKASLLNSTFGRHDPADENKSEINSPTHESPDGSPEMRRKSIRAEEDGDRVRLPPIRKLTHRSSQIMFQKDKDDAAPPDGKTQTKGMYVQTGNNKTRQTPSPVKHSVSSQSVIQANEASHQSAASDGPKVAKSLGSRSRLPSKSRSQDSRFSLPAVGADAIKNEELAASTLSLFSRYRGVPSRDYALKCLSVANTYKELPWLHQVRIAMEITARGVKKAVVGERHLSLDPDPVDVDSLENMSARHSASEVVM